MATRKSTKKTAKKAANFATKHPKIVIALTIIVVVIIAAAILLYVLKPELFHKTLGIGEHSWGEYQTVTQATCGASGLEARECAVCGEKDSKEIPAIGEHSWGNYETVSLPDCEKNGLEERVCAVCGEKDSKEIPAIGEHSWGNYETVSLPNCEKSGLEERVCAVCGEKDSKEIPATGEHSWGNYETVSLPSCEKSGLEERKCIICGKKDGRELPALNHDFGDGDTCSVCGYDKSSFIGLESEITEENTLSIHFIAFENDKAGDCTLIKYGNTEVLIDAGSRQNSATTIKKYLDKYCTDGTLEYVIATHADQDHIAAFVGTSTSQTYNGILYSYKIGTVIQFDKTNKSPTTTSGARSLYGKYCDAVDYAAKNGATIYTASQCWYNRNGAKRTYYLDTENKISLNILYNYYYENNSSDENNYSVCTLLTQQYEGGANNYLFTGDLEAEGEAKLVEKNDLPEVELFKGGHHGSPTSSNECLLSVIKPKHVAVCCCAGTDEYTKNPLNQFPSQDFVNRVSKYTDSVYCTNVVADNADGYENMNGNIVFYCTYDSKKVKLWCSNNTVKLKDTEWFKANRSTENTPWA